MGVLTLILVLLLCPPLMAQTAAVQPQVVTTTAPIILAGTTLCSVPKNGGACRVSQAIALAPLKATVPGQTALVSLKGATGTFTLDFSKSTTTTNPDGTATITGVVVTLVTQ